ncbi:MAG: ATP-binding protein [bacterium]|nr:ATP-binding protein [bacterium]
MVHQKGQKEQGAGVRLLLIEDDLSHAVLIRRALTKELVAEVVHVESGSEALTQLGHDDFDVVLSDLNLPDYSGIELIQLINKISPDVASIVLTSSDDLQLVVQAMSAGAWDYLTKDFSSGFRERLHLALQRAIEKREQSLRTLQAISERNAFWAATNEARDGIAILNGRAEVVFANLAFQNFTKALTYTGGEERGELFNAVVGVGNETFGELFLDRVQSLSGGALWTMEAQTGDSDRHYTISVSELSHRQAGDGGEREDGAAVVSRLASSLAIHRYVVWVRDITDVKDRERYQRELLSTTTHDLKGPLGAILTAVEVLRDYQVLPQEMVSNLLNRIGSCARTSVSLIDEFLSARRIQDGVLSIRPQHYPVADMLRDIVMDYSTVAMSRGIELTDERNNEEVDIYVDRLGFQRVIGNLVNNALKFSGAGSRVSVSAQRLSNGVMISVADTGSGIEPEKQHSLFERYGRLDKHHAVDGTGLGLYVVKSIVDAHRGRIDLTSSIGGGTTFRIFFPAQIADPEGGSEF